MALDEKTTARNLRRLADEIDPPRLMPACDLQTALNTMRGLTANAVCITISVWDHRFADDVPDVSFNVFDGKHSYSANSLELAVRKAQAAIESCAPATIEAAQALVDAAAARSVSDV